MLAGAPSRPTSLGRVTPARGPQSTHTAGTFDRSVKTTFSQARTGVVEQDVVPLLVGLVAGLGAGPAGMRRRLLREQQDGGGGTEQQLHWTGVVAGWFVHACVDGDVRGRVILGCEPVGRLMTRSTRQQLKRERGIPDDRAMTCSARSAGKQGPPELADRFKSPPGPVYVWKR